MKSIRIISLGFVMGLILLNGLTGQTSQAQQPKVPLSSPFLPTQPKAACSKDPSITFSEEQTEKLTSLQQAYKAEMSPLLSELRNLRFEMRHEISDPKVRSEVLLDKQRKISQLQAKLENLHFSYQIKVRSILTKDQLERFPPDCPLKTGAGYGSGRGRWSSKGIR